MTATAIAACAAFCVACCMMLLYRSVRAAGVGLQRLHAHAADRELADLYIFVEPRMLLLVSSVTALLFGIATLIAGLPLLLAAGLMSLILLAPRWFMAVMRRRRTRRVDAQLPEALGLLAGLLAAGQGFSPALTHLARHQRPPISQELELLLRKQRMGMSLDEALEDMQGRVPLPDVALLATAVRVSRELGGNLAESLQRLGESMRARRVLEEKIAALTSQGRLQGLIVGLLPMVLLVVLGFMEPTAMSVLFQEPLGWATLFIIAALEFTGFLLIRRIVSIQV